MTYTKEEIDKKLNDFILQYYKEEVVDVKRKNNMLLYFEDEAIESGNLIEYKIVKGMQDYIGENNLELLKEIIDSYNQNNIEFIVLKGIPLGIELFGKKNIKYSGDLDILVKEDDLKQAYLILGKMGFVSVDGSVLDEESYANDFMLSYRNHHMEGLVKKVDEGKWIACVELHRYPYPKTQYDFIYAEYSREKENEFFKNKEKIKIGDIELFRLCLTDRTIQLLVHFTTHFLNGLRDIIFWKREYIFSIRLAYELALFVLNNRIDWTDVLKKASEDGIKNEIVLATYIINEIWNGLIPLKECFDESQLEQGDFMRKMIPQLKQDTLENIINEKNSSTYIWKILRQKNALWNKNVNHLVGKKYLKNRRTGKFEVDYEYKEKKFVFRFLIDKDIFEKSRYEKCSRHIKEISGVYFFFYDESSFSIDCWEVYALTRDNKGEIILLNIGIGHQNSDKCVDLEKFNFYLSENGTIATLEIEESILRCYKEKCMGINVVSADRFDLYEYCRPDQHYIIRV